MSLCNSFGISSYLGSRKSKSSSRKDSLQKTFTNDDDFLLSVDDRPLSSVKNFEIHDFTDENAKDPNIISSYYYVKALELYKRKEYFSAIHQFKRVLAYDSLDFESFINLGACYYYLQLFDEAIAIFSKATRLNSTSPIPHINKALCEVALLDYNRTILTVDNALNVLEDPPEELYKIRTFVLFRSGKVTNILDDFSSKNGFEAKKRYSYSKVVKVKPTTTVCNKSYTKKSKTKSILCLYPEFKKSFIKIPEVDNRSVIKTRSSMTSYNNSPRSRTKSPIFANKPIITFIKNSPQPNPKIEIEKKEFFRQKPIIIDPKPCFRPGLIQIDALDRYKENLADKDSADKFNKNIQALKKYVEKDLERAEELKDESSNNEYDFVSQHEIKVLIEEFEKPEKNIQKIDKIAIKLGFIQKFPLVMRESLYK